jgi:hypothetical protein
MMAQDGVSRIHMKTARLRWIAAAMITVIVAAVAVITTELTSSDYRSHEDMASPNVAQHSAISGPHEGSAATVDAVETNSFKSDATIESASVSTRPRSIDNVK